MPKKPKKFPFTQAYLRSRLHYDKKSGVFTWRYNPDARPQWNGRYEATVAGTLNLEGYIQIRIDGTFYLAHRLAWYYVHGEQPDEIDHRNTIRNNNWLDNLRPANSQNQHNKSAYSNNTTGYKGVSLFRGRYQAQIQVRKKLIYLGRYDTAEEASSVYIEAAKKHHAEFARW